MPDNQPKPARTEQLPPLIDCAPLTDEVDVQRSYLEQRETQLHDAQRTIAMLRQHLDMATSRKDEITEALDAALRSNREKDAKIAELEADKQALKSCDALNREECSHWAVQSAAAEAGLRAVSEAMKNPDPWACLKRVRAVMDTNPSHR